jgi:type VI secretion system protein ImpG
MSRPYYIKELQKLRSRSKDFAREYPNIAGLLTADATDPDVERLLEGVAYLTANVQEKIDDEFPELLHALIAVFFPSYLRPVPSYVMEELIPKPTIGQAIIVPRGTQVTNKLVNVNSDKCTFRTVAPINMEPLKLRNAQFGMGTNGQHFLKLNLVFLAITPKRWDAEILSLYFGDNFSQAANIVYLLLRYCDKIGLQTQGAEEFYLPTNCLRLKQLSDAAAFDLDTQTDMPNRFILRQYLTFSQQFLQLELTQLDTWQNRGDSIELSITFYFREIPQWFIIPDSVAIHLNTVPMVNLFEESAQPINYDQTHYEYRILADSDHAEKKPVYAVKNVRGSSGFKRSAEYTNFSRALNNLNSLDTYQVHYRKKNAGDGVDWYISVNGLQNPKDENALAVTEDKKSSIQVDLLCSNGSLARQIAPGVLAQSSSSIAAVATFGNLHTPTVYYPLVLNDRVLWRLLSLLAYNFFAEADLSLLKDIIKLEVDFLFGFDRKVIENRLNGITGITVTRANRLYRNSAIVGYDILLKCDLNKFDSHGDLFIFANVLEVFFANQVPFNTYIKLSVKIDNTGELLSWPARTVDKILD